MWVCDSVANFVSMPRLSVRIGALCSHRDPSQVSIHWTHSLLKALSGRVSPLSGNPYSSLISSYKRFKHFGTVSDARKQVWSLITTSETDENAQPTELNGSILEIWYVIALNSRLRAWDCLHIYLQSMRRATNSFCCCPEGRVQYAPIHQSKQGLEQKLRDAHAIVRLFISPTLHRLAMDGYARMRECACVGVFA